MAISEFAKNDCEKMFPEHTSALLKTDPEFIERFDNFAFDEVVQTVELDGKTRFLAILAALLGCQGIDEFRVMLPAALNMGVTPVEAKEVVYQAAAYLGIGRVYPFLNAANEVLEARGVTLPLAGQAANTMENRVETGAQAQGGCEPQLTSHAAGNMRIGNDKAFLIKIVSACLPFIGYPRSLNALSCVENAAGQSGK